jgi:Mg-chelatase subunit ChlD
MRKRLSKFKYFKAEFNMASPLQVEIYQNRRALAAGQEGDVYMLAKIVPSKELREFVSQNPRKVHMAFLLDVSASMCGEKIEAAKEAILRRFRNDLQDDDILSLVVFSTSAVVAINSATKKYAATEVESVIRSIDCGGSTSLYQALTMAVNLLSKTPPGYTRVMIVATDGRPTDVADPNQVLELTKLAREKYNIITFIYGIGEDYDPALCEEMAKIGGGRMRHVKGAKEIEGLTQAIVSAIKNIVIEKPTLKIETEVGTKLEEAFLIYPTLGVLDPGAATWDVGAVSARDVIIASFRATTYSKDEGRRKIATVFFGTATRPVEVEFVAAVSSDEQNPEVRLYHEVARIAVNILEKTKQGLSADEEFAALNRLLAEPVARSLMARDIYFAALAQRVLGTQSLDGKTRIDRLSNIGG